VKKDGYKNFEMSLCFMPACKKPECHDTKTDAVCDTCLLDLKEEREAWDYMNGIMKERKE